MVASCYSIMLTLSELFDFIYCGNGTKHLNSKINRCGPVLLSMQCTCSIYMMVTWTLDHMAGKALIKS